MPEDNFSDPALQARPGENLATLRPQLRNKISHCFIHDYILLSYCKAHLPSLSHINTNSRLVVSSHPIPAHQPNHPLPYHIRELPPRLHTHQFRIVL